MRETEPGGWEVGLGGKELSPIQQGRAVVGFPKIEKEGGEIGAAREVGVVRETLAPRQPFLGTGEGVGKTKALVLHLRSLPVATSVFPSGDL